MSEQFRKALAVEWRVTHRTLSPLGFLVAAAVGIFTLATTERSTASLTAWSYHSRWTQFLALLLMLLMVWMASRERAAGQTEVTGCWPIDQWSYLSARYLAVFGPAAAYLAILHAALWAWDAVAVGRLVTPLPFLPAWLSSLVTVAFGLAVALLVADRLGQTYLAYPVLVLYWMGATILVPSALGNVGGVGIHAIDFTLGSMAWYFSPVSGFAPRVLGLWLNRGLYLAAAAGVLAATLLARRRRHGDTRLFLATVALVLSLTMVAGLAGWSAWDDLGPARSYRSYVKGLQADRAFLVEAGLATPANAGGMAPAANPAPKDPGFRITSYGLALSFNRPTGLLKVRATMRLVPSAGRDLLPEDLRLTLRDRFVVEQVSLAPAAGSANPTFVRHGSYLDMAIPAGLAETALTLEYQGRIQEWRRAGFVKVLSPGPLVSPDLIWLPASYAWYPLPGWFDLAGVPIHAGRDIYYEELPLSIPPAEHHLTFEGLGDLAPVTGLDGPSGLSLLAGHYRAFRCGPLEIYLSPEFDQTAAESLAAGLDAQLRLMTKYLPPIAEGAVVVQWSSALSGGRHFGAWSLSGTARLGDSLAARAALGRLGDLSSLDDWSLHSLNGELLSLYVPDILAAGNFSVSPALAVQEFLAAAMVLEERGPRAYAELIALRKVSRPPEAAPSHTPGIWASGPDVDRYVLAFDLILQKGGPEAIAATIGAAFDGHSRVTDQSLRTVLMTKAERLGVGAEVSSILAGMMTVVEPE